MRITKEDVLTQLKEKTIDWYDLSWHVAKWFPDYIKKDLYNWKEASWAIARYCPEHFDKDLYNWEEDFQDVIKYCPHLLKYCPIENLKYFNTIPGTD